MPNLPPLPTVSPPPNYVVSENQNSIPPGVKIGDFIVGKYTDSGWGKWFPGSDYTHAALIVNLDPFEIIEAAGDDVPNQIAGPARVLFSESPMWGKASLLIKMKWARPVFPNPIREIDKKSPRSDRKIISELEARKRVVAYAEKQLGEEYSLELSENQTKEYTATKWDEDEWYCSLLVYKSFSRTITDMYLGTDNPGFWYTPMT